MDIFNNIIKNRTLSEQGRNVKLHHDKAKFLSYIKTIWGHLVEYGFNDITFDTKVDTNCIHGTLLFDEDNGSYVEVMYYKDHKRMLFKFSAEPNEPYGTFELHDSYSKETLVKFLDEYYTDYEEDDEFFHWMGNENIGRINNIFK